MSVYQQQAHYRPNKDMNSHVEQVVSGNLIIYNHLQSLRSCVSTNPYRFKKYFVLFYIRKAAHIKNVKSSIGLENLKQYILIVLAKEYKSIPSSNQCDMHTDTETVNRISSLMVN